LEKRIGGKQKNVLKYTVSGRGKEAGRKGQNRGEGGWCRGSSSTKESTGRRRQKRNRKKKGVQKKTTKRRDWANIRKQKGTRPGF